MAMEDRVDAALEVLSEAVVCGLISGFRVYEAEGGQQNARVLARAALDCANSMSDGEQAKNVLASAMYTIAHEARVSEGGIRNERADRNCPCCPMFWTCPRQPTAGAKGD